MKAKDIDTVISASVVGHPVRAIKNKLATEYNQAEKISWLVRRLKRKLKSLVQVPFVTLLLMEMWNMVQLWLDKFAGLVRKEETCAEILEDLYTGAAKVIKEEAARWADVNV